MKVNWARSPALKRSAKDCRKAVRGEQSHETVFGTLATKSRVPKSLGTNSSSGSQCSQPIDRSCMGSTVIKHASVLTFPELQIESRKLLLQACSRAWGDEG